jgi:hypothetical protein
MTRGQRAAQIWPLLALCAKQRQILSYDQLSKLIGVFRPGLGQLLEPIQSYCLLQQLPALTSLVVSEVTGLPGEGFIAASDVPQAQARVFEHEWASTVPTPEALDEAATRLPSNGRLLSELLKVVEAGGHGPS